MDFVEIGSRFARGGHPRPRAWDWTLRTVIRVGGKQAGFGLQTVVSSESSVASAHTFREELGYAAIALEGISTSDLLRELSFDAALSWAEISDLLDTPMCLLGVAREPADPDARRRSWHLLRSPPCMPRT